MEDDLNQETPTNKTKIPKITSAKKPKIEEKDKKKTLKFSKALEAISEIDDVDVDNCLILWFLRVLTIIFFMSYFINTRIIAYTKKIDIYKLT